MSSKKIEVSVRAFTKVQLHAAKYPHCAVNGVLLACKNTFKEEKILRFVDAIPLFHQSIQLTCMLEVSLLNIDVYCSMNDLYIAAYYEVPQSIKPKNSTSIFTTRVADKIHDNFGDSVLLLIENEKVPQIDSFKFHERSGDGKWKIKNSNVSVDSAGVDTTESLLEKQVYRDLVDFDNHLDDISLQWLNQPINKLVDMQ